MEQTVSELECRRRTFTREALPYLDVLYRVAVRLEREDASAEDLVQETMLKAFRSWHLYEPGTNVRAWLVTILRNTFYTLHARRQRLGHTVDIGEIEEFTLFDRIQEDDPEGRFFEYMVDDEVMQAVDALPEPFREVVVLNNLEGFRYEEIAKIVGVPVGTVKSRMSRGRRLLRKTLYTYAVTTGYLTPVAAG